MPICIASLPGRRELVGARGRLEGVQVGELPLGVVRELRLAHRRAEHLAVTERAARNLPAQLGVLLVRARIGLLLVQHEDANHMTSFTVDGRA